MTYVSPDGEVSYCIGVRWLLFGLLQVRKRELLS
jgi:hypothetical protein